MHNPTETIIALAMENLIAKKVNGSEYGAPNFDPMNPVLHSITNMIGNILFQIIKYGLPSFIIYISPTISNLSSWYAKSPLTYKLNKTKYNK